MTTGEPLSADLDLNIASALSNVDDLGDRIDSTLNAAGTTFTDAMDAAIASLPPVDLQVNADATNVPTDIQNAVDAAGNPTIPIDADASAVAGDIQVAIDAAGPSKIDIDADTTMAASELSDFQSQASHSTATVAVDADTSSADSALEDLAGSAEDAGGALSGAVEGSDKLTERTEALSGVTEAATGNLSGLAKASGLLSDQALPATAAISTLGFGIGELITKGIEATSAQQTFTSTLGNLAEKVQEVHIGDLNTTLSDLAGKLGDTKAAMQTAIAQGTQFAINAGASREQAAQFSQELYVLAGRAVSLRPSLGNVSDVAIQMEAGLGRARSASNLFGISISQTEINTRALNDTNKTTIGDLSTYDKTLAAAEIANERYGGSLKETIATGAQNAAIEQRRLTAEINNFLEETGKQLVVPAFDTLKAGTPIVESLATNLGGLAHTTLPVLADALDAIGPAIGPLVTGFVIFEGMTRIVGPALGILAGGLEQAAIGFGRFGTSAEVAAGEVAGASAALTEMTATSGIGLVVVLAGAAAAALGLFGGTAETGSEQLKSFTDAVTQANGALDDTTTKATSAFLKERDVLHELADAGVQVPGLLKGISDASERTANDAHELANELDRQAKFGQSNATALSYAGESVKQMREHINRLVDSLKNSDPVLGEQLSLLVQHHKLTSDVVSAIADLIDKYATGKHAAKDYKDTGLDPATGAIKDQGSATGGLTRQQGEAVDAFLKTIDAQNKLRDSYKQANDAILAQIDDTIAVSTTSLDATDAFKKYADAAKHAADEGHNNADANEAEQRALAEAESAAIRAAAAVGQKAADDAAGLDPAAQNAARIDGQVSSLTTLRDTLAPDSPLRHNLDEYIITILHVPPEMVTDTSTPGLEQAIADFENLKRLVDYLNATAVIAAVAAATATPTGILSAEGGVYTPVPGGRLLTVAEAGSTEVVLSAGNTREENLSLLRRGGLGDLASAPLPKLAGISPFTSQALSGDGQLHHDESIHIGTIDASGQPDPLRTTLMIANRLRIEKWMATP